MSSKQEAAGNSGNGHGAPAPDRVPLEQVRARAASPAQQDGGDARVTDAIARLTTAVEGLRERVIATESRLAELDTQVNGIASIAETLSAKYSPFAEPDDASVPLTPKERPGNARAGETPARHAAPAPTAPASADVILERLTRSPTTDLLLLEWGRLLVGALGHEGAKERVRAFEGLGWLGRPAAGTLTRHVDVLAESMPDGRRSASADSATVDWWSRFLVERLAAANAEGEGREG